MSITAWRRRSPPPASPPDPSVSTTKTGGGWADAAASHVEHQGPPLGEAPECRHAGDNRRERARVAPKTPHRASNGPTVRDVRRLGVRSFLAASLLALSFVGLASQAAAEVDVNCPGPRTGDKRVRGEHLTYEKHHVYGLGCLNVSVSAASATEGDPGWKLYTFRVESLIAPGPKAIPHGEYFGFDVLLGGTATKGEDYVLLTKSAWNSRRPPSAYSSILFDSSVAYKNKGEGVGAEYHIRVLDDEHREPDETVTFTIAYRKPRTGAEAEYQIGTASATLTIRDDDAAPGLVLSRPSLAVYEGEDAAYTVRLASRPTASVTVAIAGHEGAGLTPAPASLTFTTSDWATARTVTVAAGEDDDAANDTATLTHTASGGGYATVTADLAVTTVDDDPAVMKMVDAMIVRHRDVTGNRGALAKWEKALKTLKGQPGGFTIAELEAQVARLTGAPRQRWQRVLDAVRTMQHGGATPAVPAITLTAGAAVTEGTAASFTLAAEPAPKADLAVTVSIGQTGGYGVGSARNVRTVTIPAGKAEAAFTVATKGDDEDAPDGRVTATVEAGAGYMAGAPASVAVRDDDATAVTLSTDAGDIAETGGRKLLTVTLSRALAEGETLAVPLVFGGTAALGSDYTLFDWLIPQGVRFSNLDGSGTPMVTFTGPSVPATSLALYMEADGANEDAHETVMVALGALTATGMGGGAEGSGTVAFSILEPPPEVSIAAKTASVTEGADAAFTVTASRAPAEDLTVKLTVSEATGSDFVAADDEGAVAVTIPKGKTEASLTVATTDDAADEPDGTLTVRVAKGTGYTAAAAPKDAAQVAVSDDDAAAAVPALSVADVTAKESAGLMWFTVRLSLAADRAVSVSYRARESNPVSARQGEDFLRAEWDLRFAPGETEKRFWVGIFNDSHDEDPETFEVALYNARGAAIADGVAIGTIVNSDPMPAAWLARFGRTAAEQALDGIAGRMAAPRTAGVQGTIAGQALAFDAPANDDAPGDGLADRQSALASPGPLSGTGMARGFDSGASGFGTGIGGNAHGFGETSSHARHRTMTATEALLGSSFTATGAKDGHGGSFALWGRAAQSSFDGREGAFSLDGETVTAMLGADYARGKWLVGLALMQSEGEGGYRDSGTGSVRCPQPLDAETRRVLCDGAVREGDGKVEASLTTAVPYAALQASERLRLWGAAGHGTGEVTLKPAMGGSLKSDISWTMAAAGLRGDLLAPPAPGSGSGAGSGASGPALALTSDVLWARTSSEKTNDLAASDSDVTRLRLGLEGSWRVATEGGGSIVPKLTLGARHDGGDAETGFGVELGGGLAWNDPGLGLTLDVEGRTLIAHGNDDLKDRGYAASLVFDPDPATKRGPSFSLRQDWGGQATGGLDALFAPNPLEKRAGSGEATSRWTAEAAYGFPAFGDRFTGSPRFGLGLATGTRDWTLGWRLTPAAANANAPDLSLGLKATRRESDAAEPEHSVGFEITARW